MAREQADRSQVDDVTSEAVEAERPSEKVHTVDSTDSVDAYAPFEGDSSPVVDAEISRARKGRREKAETITVDEDASPIKQAAAVATKKRKARAVRDPEANAPWFKPIMFGFMLLGLLWILVYYISNGTVPVRELGPGNVLAGFGIMFIGFLMATNWK